MPSKAEFYQQMAEQVSPQLVGSWKEWTAFLTTAARLYKYPFHDAVSLHLASRSSSTSFGSFFDRPVLPRPRRSTAKPSGLPPDRFAPMI